MDPRDPLLDRLREATLALRATLNERDALLDERNEPIAIVGMGCRFPGEAESPAAYWALLHEGRDAVQPLAPRWDLAGAHPASGVPRWAGLLANPIDRFDAAFFGISPREAATLDPQHRLLLEVAWEALEDSGVAPGTLERHRTGVFIGALATDYARLLDRSSHVVDAYAVTGNLLSVAAGRLSYTLGLEGPCLTVDTACSSSLVAVHLACRSLRARECDRALAGGVSILLSPEVMEGTARTQALAPDGRCKTFDALANGFARGEGGGLVVLKRLSDAVRDGDRVWARIRGSAINQDGRSTGMTAPNVLAQEALLREALRSAGIEPSDVGFVETHGTGTSLGDPIEFEALREVVGKSRSDGTRCVLGAVKTNIGHLESAAGIAGLMKAVLALEHESIPGNLHFQTLNPRISLLGTAFEIPRGNVGWKRGDKARYAGVSSFGISGTNAHVVVEESPEREEREGTAGSAELLVVSAKSEGALRAAAKRLHGHLEGHPELELGDVAWSLATTRDAWPHRLALAVSSREEALEALRLAGQGETAAGMHRHHVEPSARGKVVFVFPGQGSQWLGMGRELLAEEPVFRKALEACDEAIRLEAGFSVLEELRAEEGSSRLGDIAVVQPVLFAMEVALAAMWRSWGVEPDCVVGHSLGETAAAYVCGALGLEEAVAVICRRSRLLKRLSGQGEMAVVELSLEEAEGALAGYEDRLGVAVSNSPRTTVLSGESRALGEVLSTLEGRDIFCRRVKVDVASHSPQVEALRDDLMNALRGVEGKRARIAMRSTVTCADVEGPELVAGYWMENLRKPVRFAPVVQSLLAEGHGIFIEMSPHPLLVTAIEEMHAGSGVAVGSLRRERPERRSLLDALGALWAHGKAIAWNEVRPGARRVALPTYPWERERHWIEATPGRRTLRAGHPLIGEGLSVSSQDGMRIWETTLEPGRLPWLSDHRVRGMVVFPGAGYLEMALAAGREIFGDAPFEVRDVALVEALRLSPEEMTVVQVVTTADGASARRFRIASQEKDGWRVHARGTLRRALGLPILDKENLRAMRARMGKSSTGASVYAALGAREMDYGPAFQGMLELLPGEGEALGRVKCPEALGGAEYTLHPALLDACFQVMAGALDDRGDRAWMGVEVAKLRVHQKPAGEVVCHVRFGAERRTEQGARQRSADLHVYDETGRLLVEVSGLRAQELAVRARAHDDGFLELRWEPSVIPARKVIHGRYLVLGEGQGAGEALRAALEAAGLAVVRAASIEDAGEPAPTAVVHLASLDGAAGFDGADPPDAQAVEGALAKGYDRALATAQAMAAMVDPSAPRLWLVTRGAHATGEGAVTPLQAPLLGLGRVIAMEHPELRCTRLDLDPSPDANEMDRIVAELLADGDEHEIAWRRDQRLVARLVRSAPESTRPDTHVNAGGRPFRLAIASPGVLDDVVLRPLVRREPGPNEVEIAVDAAGLNFLDVLKALGTYPGLGDGPIALGGECAGRIVAVGPGVERFAVGQDVVAFAPFSFGTHVTIDARAVALRPRNLSAAEAAGVPAAFVTAWYALVDLARLGARERVLIHSATGGTGLAAVQIARYLGAEIFATAGTAAKRAWLCERGIAHAFDSRSLGFAGEVLAATSHHGVDVVLNSLSGEAIEASLSALAPDGRFIELGKKDIYADRPLTLGAFKRSLSYSAVDLAGLSERRPERVGALLREVVALFDRGVLTPLPVETFPISRARDAFRKMARAEHMGKLVLTMDDTQATLRIPPAPRPSRSRIRHDGTYLVTGGLGGLGAHCARWLAEKGAGHLVLLGRSGAKSAEQRESVAALRALGPRVTVEQADVSVRAEVEAVFARMAASGMPLAGIVHAAGVLDDGVVLKQTPSRMRGVMAPKILGAIHLAALSREAPLDFFVLYASGAGLLGSPGQAPYAASNTFLDAFAHHLAAQGRPASSIDWGVFSGVGLAARLDVRGARLSDRGARSMTPDEGIRALERVLDAGVTHAAVLPFDVRQWQASFPAAASSHLFDRLLDVESTLGAHTDDAGVAERLARAGTEERHALLRDVLSKEVSRVLRIPESKLDASAPLIGLGLDSLMGLELRHRLRRRAFVDVPVPRLLSGMTIDGLALLVSGMVAGPAAGGAETETSPAGVDIEL